MKYILIIAIIIIAGSLKAQDYSTEHFDYYLYNNVIQNEILDIADSLESNYSVIINEFNITNLQIISVKVWDNYTDFLDTMEYILGQAYNGATGYVTENSIMLFDGYSTAHTFVVHEFAHVVSLQLNPTIGNNPRWLWEAFAQYISNSFYDPATLNYIRNGDYPTLQELNTEFNSSNKIYQLGYVIIEFIINEWNGDKITDLIENNGNIQELFGINELEFENLLYQFIERKYLGVTSYEIVEFDNLIIYPNPTKGSLIIDVGNLSDKYFEINIFNIRGQLVYEDRFVNQLFMDLRKFNLDYLPKGVYLLKLFNTETLRCFKIILQY